MNKTIGTVTLNKPRTFTQYSETASRTDYVRCEPQTVELRWVDNYWLCARFEGVIESSSFTNRTVGEPATAGAQWSYAGFDPSALAEAGFDVDVTAGRVEQVGVYSEGCSRPGAPIMFYRAS